MSQVRRWPWAPTKVTTPAMSIRSTRSIAGDPVRTVGANAASATDTTVQPATQGIDRDRDTASLGGGASSVSVMERSWGRVVDEWTGRRYRVGGPWYPTRHLGGG